MITYWKGKKDTNKENQFGTVKDNGFVPDSIITTKEEYDNYISKLVIIVPELTDIEKLIIKAKIEKWI